MLCAVTEHERVSWNYPLGGVPMCLRVFTARKKCYWQLRDRHNRIVLRSPKGFATFEAAKDHARFAMEGLRNCLR